MFLKYDFWAFLIVVYQNVSYFWNPEAKLDKIGMLQNENMCLEQTWVRLKIFLIRINLSQKYLIRLNS